jgi:hypothetical protein
MHIINESVKSTMLCALVLLVALQQALALGAASLQMARAQDLANDDTVLICSGQGMKWISLSQSAAQGRFVYIDPSELDASTPNLIDCTNTVLGDTFADEYVHFSQPVVGFAAIKAALILVYQSPYAAIAYLAHQVRGPPEPSLIPQYLL